MPNVYALAAHPLGQAAIRLAQEEHKTKGARAIFGVILMFGILCVLLLNNARKRLS